MEFATGAIGALLPKLGELLKEEYNLKKSVKQGIQFLVDELESMQAALRTVSGVPADQLEEHVKIWARAVREMSYEIEDKVDDFLVRSEGKKLAKAKSIKGFVRRCRNSVANVKLRHKMAADIIDIKCRVKEAKERRDRYDLGNVVPNNNAAKHIDPRVHFLFKKATELVGIDEAIGKLINMLSQGEDVSVVGVGGLGKTTLAKAVYDKLKVEFQVSAFVSVGQSPDIVKVLKDILYELDKKMYGTIHNTLLDSEQLIQLIRNFLENERYLIVIDDMWDIQPWETIRLALDQNSCGSRTITTTRIFDVAEKSGKVYHLEPLSYENSKKLFCTRIFGLEGKCPQNQPFDVPIEILHKCGGIPLAIITIASLLAGKPREEWPTVYSSIGFSDKGNMDVENTMRILSFSFYDMLPHLRTCLLYLSVFPEDYIIHKNILIWMWVAEGFVKREKEVGLFELGERYFNELINRSMIQPVEVMHIKGLVDGCRIHDMVLGLVRSLAREENFVTIFDHEYGASAQSIIRRLSIQNRDDNLKAAMNRMAHIRSFLAYSSGSVEMVPSLQSFKALRILDLEASCDRGGYVKLKYLGDLLHLRYLRFSGFVIDQLPEEIGNLKFLQTLDYAESYILNDLPPSIGLLAQLACLRCGSDSTTNLPDRIIGKLTSLQDLRINFTRNTDINFLAELGNLIELRVLEAHLGVLDKSLVEAFLESLQNMHELRHLYINVPASSYPRWEASGFIISRHLRFLNVEYLNLSRLPTWINSSLLPNLSFLSLDVLFMDYRDVRVLGRLPELCCLRLYTRSFLVIYGGDGYFRKLRSCWFNSAGTVMFRRDKSGAPVMPSLEDIEFHVHAQELLKFHIRLGSQAVIGLDNIPWLEKINIWISHEWGQSCQLQAQQALKNEAQAHPNHPSLDIRTYRVNDRIAFYSESDIYGREVIHLPVHVRELNDGYDFKLWRLSSCWSIWDELDAAEEGLRHAVNVNPNHPTLEMERLDEDKMKYSCSRDQQAANHDPRAQHKDEDVATVSAEVKDEEEEGEQDALSMEKRCKFLPACRG